MNKSFSFYENILKTITKSGHQLIGVEGSSETPSFTYSIGLSEKHGYELIMVGLKPLYAGHIMNAVAEHMKKQPLEMGKAYPDFANLPLVPRECIPKRVEKYTVQADQYYEKPVKVVQIVMCDREGKFPEDKGYDTAYMAQRQPLLYKL